MNTLANRCSFSKLSSFSRSFHFLATAKELQKQKFNPMKMPSDFKSAVGSRQLSVQSNSISREASNLKSFDELCTEADLQRVRKAYEEKLKKFEELKKTAADLEALDQKFLELQRNRKVGEAEIKRFEELKKIAADLEALDQQLVLWKYAGRSLADLQRAHKADEKEQKAKRLFFCNMNTLANRCYFSNLSSFSRSVHFLATAKDLQKFNPMKMPSEFKSAVGRRQLSVQSNSNRFFSQEPSDLESWEARLQRSRKSLEESLNKLDETTKKLERDNLRINILFTFFFFPLLPIVVMISSPKRHLENELHLQKTNKNYIHT
ncbi:hypothetical protein niasHT_017554 [Heterodera trifolii]|uniref:Uncharacterized protein n=1 Tax=Heterodera trifolii TaxID=157864 RepID=A0ABD2L667_9BILA